MSQLTFNTTNNRRVPITRNNMFYSESDFMLETQIGKCYLEEDVNQTVILYQVDLEKSNLDAVYKESNINGLVFKTPVELHVLYQIEQGELTSYDKTKNLGTYVKGGKLTFGIFQATLDELGADIKIGDYIAIPIDEKTMVQYTVTNDGRNNYDNEHTTFGYKSSWRTIECAFTNWDEGKL